MQNAEPLIEESTVSSITNAIRARRMEVPAIFLLEMHKPLAGLAAHAVRVLEPLLAALVGTSQISAALQVLQSPDAIERVIQALEESNNN